MGIKPLQDWVVIEGGDADTEQKTAGGLIIPDTAKERKAEGKVVAVGPGRLEEEDIKNKNKERKYIKTVLKPGDKVVYEQYSAKTVAVASTEWIMVRESDVLGYI